MCACVPLASCHRSDGADGMPFTPQDASATNGHRVNGFGENGRGGFAGGRGGARRSPPARAQRVPVAEDFPVLSGSRTPPLGTNGHVNGSVTPNGPTAAQVLRAPAPVQKDQTRSPAPSETPKVGLFMPLFGTCADSVLIFFSHRSTVRLRPLPSPPPLTLRPRRSPSRREQ